jgi:hypothetical protein
LRGGLASPRFDGDAVGVTVESSRTSCISGRGVRPTLSPVCADGGILLPLIVRSNLHNKKLPGRTDWRPTLSYGALWSVFMGHLPRLQGNRFPMWGRQGRQSCPSFHFPLIDRRRSRGGLRSLPFCCPSSDAPIPLSLLMATPKTLCKIVSVVKR